MSTYEERIAIGKILRSQISLTKLVFTMAHAIEDLNISEERKSEIKQASDELIKQLEISADAIEAMGNINIHENNDHG